MNMYYIQTKLHGYMYCTVYFRVFFVILSLMMELKNYTDILHE